GTKVDVLLLALTGRRDEGQVLPAINGTSGIVHAEKRNAPALACNRQGLAVGESLVDGYAVLIGPRTEEPAVGRGRKRERGDRGRRQTKRGTVHLWPPRPLRSSSTSSPRSRARRPLRQR